MSFERFTAGRLSYFSAATLSAGIAANMPSLSKSRLAELLSDRAFHLIIIPTENCNFRCTYCYEKFNKTMMKPQTREAIKTLIRRRAAGLDRLYVGWFGGEPLLARSIIMDISEYIMRLTESHALDYTAGMATNGYFLTPSRLAELVQLGICDYQITLDGPRQIHDTHRARANGEGTFARIWTNLLAIRDGSEQVHILLRVHFDPSRILHLGALIEDVRREFLPDRRFAVQFQAVRRLGGTGDARIEIFSEAEEQRHMKMLQRQLYGDRDAREAGEPPYVCYASRPNSLVIYADGDIGKCTVALHDPINKIGSIREDGTVSMDPELLKLWLRGFMMKPNLSILRCPLKNFPEPPLRAS